MLIEGESRLEYVRRVASGVYLPYGHNCPFDWVGSRLDGYIFDGCVANMGGLAWQLKKKISQRISPQPDDENEVCEAIIVYECSEIKGRAPDAIAKVRMQLPNILATDLVLREPVYYADQATWETSQDADKEADNLFELKRRGCQSMPQFLWYDVKQQDLNTKACWVPGGYISTIIMEKLPGVPVSTVWKKGMLSKKQKRDILAAFEIAFMDVYSHYFCPDDCQLRNLMWDEASERCYLIDVESFKDFQDEPEEFRYNASLMEGEYGFWDVPTKKDDDEDDTNVKHSDKACAATETHSR